MENGKCETSLPDDYWHGNNSQLVMVEILKIDIGLAVYYIIQKRLGGEGQKKQFNCAFGFQKY